MSSHAAPSIGVLGLGNPLRTDDGVGIHAVRMLLESSRLLPDVQVIDGGTLGLDLLHRIVGITHLLVLDAVDTGAAPGSLSRFAGAELMSLPTGRSVHLLGLTDLLSALTLLDRAPEEVVLLGVQPGSTDWGVALSPAIDAAVSDFLQAAFSQIARWAEGTRFRKVDVRPVTSAIEDSSQRGEQPGVRS